MKRRLLRPARRFLPFKSLDLHPNNLPFQLTSFIARTGEITLVEAALERSRLFIDCQSGMRLSLEQAVELAHTGERRISSRRR